MAESLRGLTLNPMHEDQDAVLESLCSKEAYPHAAHDIRTIETHISWVYLTGPFAYKIKKAVKLPYLDFSTLERRERACRDELSLNLRLAPELYQEVVTIGGDDSHLRVGGTPAIEFAVKISQFPDGAIADQLVQDDALNPPAFSALAEAIAAFHQTLTPALADAPGNRILSNLAELDSALTSEQRIPLQGIREWLNAELNRLSHVFAGRNATGHIRECHGDLHLGNIVRIDGRLIAFDCLEFSLALRTIDVVDEVAFLFMDLMAHGRSDLAFTFLSSYLELTGDYTGLRLLRIYAVHRALVRAKVEVSTLHQAEQATTNDGASRYLNAALALSRMLRPLCLITCGLSGSGKSTIASQLVASLGAVHLRSDTERKRLRGLKPTARTNSDVEQGIYNPDTTDETYRHLASCAESALAGGVTVIIDASFIDRRYRDLFRAMAARLDAGFIILSCEAPTELLRTRIAERYRQQSDASEANLDVLEHQLRTADAFGDDESASVFAIRTAEAVDTDRLAREVRA